MTRYSTAQAKPKISAPYTTVEKTGASQLNADGRHDRYQTPTPRKAMTSSFCASDSEAIFPEGNAIAPDLEPSDTLPTPRRNVRNLCGSTGRTVGTMPTAIRT